MTVLQGRRDREGALSAALGEAFVKRPKVGMCATGWLERGVV